MTVKEALDAALKLLYGITVTGPEQATRLSEAARLIAQAHASIREEKQYEQEGVADANDHA